MKQARPRYLKPRGAAGRHAQDDNLAGLIERQHVDVASDRAVRVNLQHRRVAANRRVRVVVDRAERVVEAVLVFRSKVDGHTFALRFRSTARRFEP